MISATEIAQIGTKLHLKALTHRQKPGVQSAKYSDHPIPAGERVYEKEKKQVLSASLQKFLVSIDTGMNGAVGWSLTD